MNIRTISFVLSTVVQIAYAFSPCRPLIVKSTQRRLGSGRAISSSPSSVLRATGKGFGETTPSRKEKSVGQVDRETKAAKYDEISASGGQEYNIYVRQFGSDDESWLPCGAIAVPRAAQVSDAIFANVGGLESAIVRTYPKLKGYEQEFEYGYNLKVYPDDPVEVAVKGQGQKSSGLSIGNWISTLLSPVDTSEVPPPPVQE